MPIQNAITSNTTFTQFSGGAKSVLGHAVVYSVILDDKHPLIKNGNEHITHIGAIEFRYVSKSPTDDDNLPIAFPIDKNFRNLPVINETVEIIDDNSGLLYYRRIGLELSPNVNSDTSYISTFFKPVSVSSVASYIKSAAVGIISGNGGGASKFDKYGDYFKPQKVHKLKLYEGDSVFESRFGQSIRFSGYNNDGNKYSPTIIIRNYENAKSQDLKATELTEEDVNMDGSTIALTSQDYKSAFQPGTVNNGSSDIETKPKSFKDYPSELKGHQMLFSSDRIIISARKSEMIFYSKKNYGFISDGQMSMDNKLGIEINVGGDTNIKTNSKDINMNTDSGHVNVGNTDLEPLVKGNQLVTVLQNLIDAINQQVYLTPAGPSAPGPVNKPAFEQIKANLKVILSKLNNVS